MKLAEQHHCEWVKYSVEAERKQRHKEKREKEEQQRRNLKVSLVKQMNITTHIKKYTHHPHTPHAPAHSH